MKRGLIFGSMVGTAGIVSTYFCVPEFRHCSLLTKETIVVAKNHESEEADKHVVTKNVFGDEFQWEVLGINGNPRYPFDPNESYVYVYSWTGKLHPIFVNKKAWKYIPAEFLKECISMKSIE